MVSRDCPHLSTWQGQVSTGWVYQPVLWPCPSRVRKSSDCLHALAQGRSREAGEWGPWSATVGPVCGLKLLPSSWASGHGAGGSGDSAVLLGTVPACPVQPGGQSRPRRPSDPPRGGVRGGLVPALSCRGIVGAGKHGLRAKCSWPSLPAVTAAVPLLCGGLGSKQPLEGGWGALGEGRRCMKPGHTPCSPSTQQSPVFPLLV